MKLFSRKALAAVATTVALTTASLSAPAFADEGPTSTSTVVTLAQADNGSSNFLGSSSSDDEESSSKDMDAKEIREWVSVFTAVIGALSAAFVFIQRLTN